MPGAAEASTIYSQPSGPLATADVWASQNDTNSGGFGNFATAYDDFTLGFDASIEDVHWQGGYFFGGPATIDAFTLTFYADEAGLPGASLWTETIAGDANETFIGSNANYVFFSYSTLLGSPFAATAGTTYWLSIVPDLGYPPQWGWTNIEGDGTSVQDFFDVRFVREKDLVFDLTGTPVPEPASLTLLGLGLAGMAGRRWRQRRRA